MECCQDSGIIKKSEDKDTFLFQMTGSKLLPKQTNKQFIPQHQDGHSKSCFVSLNE
jgi:hypothetical protein